MRARKSDEQGIKPKFKQSAFKKKPITDRSTRSSISYQSASHAHAPKQEAGLVSSINARLVKASGSGYEVGDVRVKGVIRIDCKSTINNSYSLKAETMEHLQMAAMQDGEVPALQLDFLTTDGEVEQRLAIIPLWALEQLIANQSPSS